VPTLELESGDLASVALTAEKLEAADLVLITANHSAIDYDLVGSHASLMVDPRNAMAGVNSVRATVYPIAGPPGDGSTRNRTPVGRSGDD
jgi:UDP-N-acetyl-D-glucosamine dehydrogenase